jgi:hypothetical protein
VARENPSKRPDIRLTVNLTNLLQKSGSLQQG